MNPALPNKSFDPPILSDGIEKSKMWVLFVRNDDLVNPFVNEEILKMAGAEVTIGDHGHRTPDVLFQEFFNEVYSEIIKK